MKEATRRIEKLKSFLTDDHPTLAVLALKFCLSHAAVSTVIPGMRKLKHVQANCAASDGKLLTHQELRLLSEHAFVHGWKYPWSQEIPKDNFFRHCIVASYCFYLASRFGKNINSSLCSSNSIFFFILNSKLR
ncbi:hypothetical protein CEE34_11420 [Candidatus Aerophobetes bacterium Ae_b3a]|nr:MAG: hypothetical protein CEE34_11420 [Candidatus Aerophobetes bacterium Ae_b3a]